MCTSEVILFRHFPDGQGARGECLPCLEVREGSGISGDVPQKVGEPCSSPSC